MLDDCEPQAVIDDVLRYTNRDRFPPVGGFKTMAAHWHFAYTIQAMANGLDWTPPFKPVLQAMGVDSAIIMDFHGDGHPRDLTERRLQELQAYFAACRKQSDSSFLLIPSEEANVHLGGHWALMFPKPVYWLMGRRPGTEFRTADPKYGTVYRVGNEKELLELVRLEGGYAFTPSDVVASTPLIVEFFGAMGTQREAGAKAAYSRREQDKIMGCTWHEPGNYF